MGRRNQSRLAMALLVKNEIDIIELNIRFHASRGVERFIVMDNGSTDGTLEKLQELRGSLDITLLSNPNEAYQQAKWMTMLAKQAHANHVILCDADEFWLPVSTHSLADSLIPGAAVQRVPRMNMIYTQAMHGSNRPFYESDLCVTSPIAYAKSTQLSATTPSLQLASIKPKTIVKPFGLRYVHGGNHGAKNWFQWRSPQINNNINVFHYPIRGYAHFHQNIEHRAKIQHLPGVKMGAHYHRWIELFRNGELEQEFNRILLDNDQIACLKRLAVITNNSTMQDTLSQLHASLAN